MKKERSFVRKEETGKIIFFEKKVLTFLLDSVYNSKAVSDNADQERDLSSAGRASALQAEGHRFEPYRSHSFAKKQKKYGEIAQLARAYGSYP